jgi:hypothetical protein
MRIACSGGCAIQCSCPPLGGLPVVAACLRLRTVTRSTRLMTLPRYARDSHAGIAHLRIVFTW